MFTPPRITTSACAVGQVEVSVRVEMADVSERVTLAAPRGFGLPGVLVVLEPAARARHVDEPRLSDAENSAVLVRTVTSTPGQGRPTLPGRSRHSSGEIRLTPPSLAP